MPWTFAHPAAVLPLKALCPRYLRLPALFVGSLTPDFGYYINLYGVGIGAHSFKGSLSVCVPAGILLLTAFYIMRRPVWWLLPAPHRQAVAPLVNTAFAFNGRFALSSLMSILIGAWIHIAWDSFTHAGTWASRRFAVLRESWLSIGSTDLAGYTVLQHGSTLAGVAALGIAYLCWLRGRPTGEATTMRDGWRYLVMLGLPIVSFVIAVSIALPASMRPSGRTDVPAFLFKSAILGMSFWLSVLFVYAVVFQIRSALGVRTRVKKPE